MKHSTTKLRRILTDNEILDAIQMREGGMSVRKLALLFEVSPSNIRDNVCWGTKQANLKRYQRANYNNPTLTWRSIKSVFIIVHSYKNNGYTSMEVSEQFNIPLQDVNYIWTKEI